MGRSDILPPAGWWALMVRLLWCAAPFTGSRRPATRLFSSGSRPGRIARPFIPVFSIRVTSESCSWIIRKDDTLIFGGCFSPQDSREAYNRQKSRLEEYLGHSLGRPIKTEACQAVRPRGFSGFYHWPGWRISYWGSGGLYQRQLLRRNQQRHPQRQRPGGGHEPSR